MQKKLWNKARRVLAGLMALAMVLMNLSDIAVYADEATDSTAATEWVFSSEDFYTNVAASRGDYTYNGLEIKGGQSHQDTYLYLYAGGTVAIPVAGDSVVTVNGHYAYSFYFEENADAVITVDSTAPHTYTYTGDAGYVTITATDQCYLTSIKVEEMEEEPAPVVITLPTTWDFADATFTSGDYENKGAYNYNGLSFTSGRSHGGTYLHTAEGTISVPVPGDCTVTVNSCYKYSYYFADQSEASVGVDTGSTSQIDAHSYDYKGEAGTVNITVAGESYINSISITETVAKEPDSETVDSEVTETTGDISVSTADELLEAIEKIEPGYSIKVKSGTYKFSKSILIAEENAGTADAMKKLVADGGNVVFDFSDMGYTGSEADKSNRGIILDGSYWHIKGITIKNAADNGMLLSGDNNIIEMCVFEGNHDTGLQISRYQTDYNSIAQWPTNNLIKNCTSFNNSDIEGENADGFAAKLTCGEGNVFDGCMAYNNSDDGWDLYAKTATGPIGVVTIKNSIAFRNGKLTNGEGSSDGDMNGFKLGGSGVGTPHVLVNCIAFENGAHGFTDNNNPTAVSLTNCTSFNNSRYESKKANFQMDRENGGVNVNLLSFTTDSMGSDGFVGTVQNSVYYNNKPAYFSVTSSTAFDGKEKLGTEISVTTADFISTSAPDTTTDFHTTWRDADGNIDTKGFLKVADSSALATMASDGSALGAKLSGNDYINVNPGTGSEDDKDDENTGSDTPGTGTTGGTDAVLNASDLTAGDITEKTAVGAFTINATSGKKVTIDGNKKEIDDFSFTQRIKLGGTGTVEYRNIEYTATDAATLTVYAMSGSGSADRALVLANAEGTVVATNTALGASISKLTYEIPSAGTYYLYSTDSGINVYYVSVAYAEAEEPADPVEPGTPVIPEEPAETTGNKIEVWDLGGEQLDSSVYENKLNADIINSWYPGVEAGTKGVNLATFQVKDAEGNVEFGFNDGGFSTTHRLRTMNTNLTRYDEKNKTFGGTTYNGFIYSNKGATSAVYVELYVEEGDIVTLAVSSNGTEADYVFEAPSGDKQTGTYDAADAGTLLTFYGKESGVHKLYTTKEKLVLLRAYVQHTPLVEVSGSVSAPAGIPAGYAVTFTNTATGAVTEAVVSNGTYTANLHEAYTYEVALKDANGYVVTSADEVTLKANEEPKKDFDVTVQAVELVTVTGTFTGVDASVVDAMTIKFTSDEIYVPEVIVSGTGYTAQLETGVEYAIVISGINDYELSDITTIKATEAKTQDIAIAKKPVYAVTINPTGATVADLAEATFTFTNLNEKGYVYTFTGTEGIELRDGVYSVKVENSGAFVQKLTSNLKVNGAAVTKTIGFESDITEWDFRTDSYNGQSSYNGLTITNGKKHGSTYGMANTNGSIVVPVSGPCEVIVSVGYNWDVSFEDGTVSYTDKSNSGDIDVSYSYTGAAGTVTIYTGSTFTSYIKQIKVVTSAPYKEVVTVGAAGCDYTTINDALDAVRAMPREDGQRVTIEIQPGNYEEMLVVDVANVTLKNASATPSIETKDKGVNIDENAVRITSYYGHGYTYYSMGSDCKYDAELLAVNKENGYASFENPGSGTTAGSYWNATVVITASGFEAEGIIFENSFNQYVSEKAANDVIVAQSSAKEGSVPRADMKAGDTTVQDKKYVERAAALAITNNCKEVFFDNCKFIGRQDTLYGGTGVTAAFYDCAVYGGTDYIFGGMTAVFAKCDLVFNTSEDKNDVGYITAAQTPANTRGLLMYNCTVTSTVPGVDTASEYPSKPGYLGRPWQAGTAEAVFCHTIIDAADAHWSELGASLIQPAGWLNTLSGESAMSAEYGTYEMAAGVDNQSARASWATTLSQQPILADGTVISVPAFLGTWMPFEDKDMDIVLPDGKVDNTPEEEPEKPSTTVTTYKFDAAELTAAKDKEEVTEGTTFADGYFKSVGAVIKRTSGDGSVKSVELGKNLTGAIQFTVTETADVKLSMSSTGGSNTSAVALVDEAGNVIANNEGLTEVSSTTATSLSYTGLVAGTYRVVSPDSSYNRGARLYSVVVDEVVAVKTVEYEFDATELTAAADKEAVAEGTPFAEGYFKSVGTVTKRTNSDGSVKAVELGKALTGAIQFTVTGEADVEVSMSSTGGSNASAVALIDEAGNVVANKEGITEVTGTSETTMTYTALPAGTYRVVSPDSSYNRGARLFSIVVAETSSGSRPARADWASVAAPEITSVALDEKNPNNIIVSVKGIIGYDGADSIVVNMFDAEGGLAATASYASDCTECTVTLTPEASGKYSFVAEMVRVDEEAKACVEAKEFDFTLPLVAPTITGAFNAGAGLVEVEWDAVKEATSYEVTVDSTEISYTTEELIQTVEGLTVGETYTIKVTAVRGEEKKTSSVEITVSEEKEVKWYFSAYGSSTNTKNNGYELLDDGSVRVYSTGGKGKIVPGSTDGLAYYYTTIDPDTTNFTLSATAVVNNWTLSNGQEGFGIMASDRAGKHGDGTAFWNNAYMAIASKVEYYYDTVAGEVTDDTSAAKVSMKLGVGSQEKVGVTAENLADFDANKTEVINKYFTSTTTTLESSCGASGAGTYNIVGNYTGTEPTGTVENTVTEFKFTIQKNNTGYFVSYTDAEGNTTTQKYYDTQALSQIEEDSVCLGFFASRNADVTFKDIEFTTIAPEDDAPAEERPVTLVTPNFAITSATVSNSADYELVYVGNADGTLIIKNALGKVLLKNTEVKANEKVTLDVKLALGNNTYKVTFTPDADYVPGEYQKLASYETVSFKHVVNYKAYGEAGASLYVAPNGSAKGNGTKASPLDIYTAVKYVQAGQTIVIMEGTYNLTSTVKVERGIDGTAENMIYMVADPEAASRPVFDFGGHCAGMVLAGDYWYFKGFDVTRSADAQKGIQVSGDNNVLDQVNAYRNGNTGIQISRYLGTDTYEDWPANNLILNCTSYLNADKGYEDADGFAAKLTVGDGNVFDGCIAYYNADDGWDLFAKVQTGSIGAVTIQNSIAYKNGYVLDENGNEVNAGNGNGFKMGGDSMAGGHILKNSIAFMNKAKGIDSNSCPDIKVYNSIAFNNGSYNVAFYTNTAANTDYFADGVISYRTENLSQAEQLKLVGSQDQSKVYGTTNYYWDASAGASMNSAGEKVTDAWFKSLAFTGADRNADGTIDMHGFLELTDAAVVEGGIGGTASGDVTIGKETSGKVQSSKVEGTIGSIKDAVDDIINADSKEDVQNAITNLIANLTNIWNRNNRTEEVVIEEEETPLAGGETETVEKESTEKEDVEIKDEETPLAADAEAEEDNSAMLTIGAIAALFLSVCSLIIVRRRQSLNK